MPSSPVVNVVRYSALISGIGYGIMHRQTLQTRYDNKVHREETARQEQLVAKAREQYARLQAAKAPQTTGVITNPDDPKFDLEKAMQYWERM
ncbi:F1F0 ATP synthase subunit e, mitochondrial [Malassezia sp. CBS 17886]|nr:F1F0 ATP synthase subunit e, mitochondrial [Malassezia sp. CBS 17886]